MYDVIDIKTQSLSSLLSDHQVCEFCRVVDRDKERCRTGYRCPICSSESKGGVLYFEFTVGATIDLMQEAFHSELKQDPNEGKWDAGKDAHNISVVIFFCTLRELLLNNLIRELCGAQKIPKLIYERLISDNKFHIMKQNNLLPSLIDSKWLDAISVINTMHEMDYIELNQFIEKAVKARNKFMHEGNKFSIPLDMGEECMHHIWPLINLFIGLHNHYVHPYFIRSKNNQ